MAQPLIGQSVVNENYSTAYGTGDGTVGTITTTTSADFTIGGGTSTYATGTDLILEGTGTNLIAGDCITTTGSGFSSTGGYSTYINTNSTYVNTNYGFSFDKSTINGKDGDILMDLKNMKFKVYCDSKGWIEYDMEDFSTKNKKVELNGSKDTSICEVISERKKRTVLFEKTAKPQYVTLSSGSFSHAEGINTIATGYYQNNGAYNLVGTTNLGYCNTAIGHSAIGGIANGTITNSSIGKQAINNVTVNGNLTVHGDIKVNGVLTAIKANYIA